MEKIEGVIKGIFKGGGYILQADGQLFSYYESNLRALNRDILQRNTRVVAQLTGTTVIDIQLKEDSQPWSDASLQYLLI